MVDVLPGCSTARTPFWQAAVSPPLSIVLLTGALLALTGSLHRSPGT